jgi:nucleotidyltransferase/DNA polymerase involved in DNA repair
MWGVGPVTKARLAEIGVLTIGQLAKTPGWSLERLLGPAAGEKLAALAWNRDPLIWSSPAAISRDRTRLLCADPSTMIAVSYGGDGPCPNARPDC